MVCLQFIHGIYTDATKAAAVDNEDQSYGYDWTISVNPSGIAPPTVEAARTEAIGDESLQLRRHSAQDTTRYDFIKDIGRLETVVDEHDCDCGAAITLTKGHLFWQPPNRDDVNDREFRIHDGDTLQGKGSGTTSVRNRLGSHATNKSSWMEIANSPGVTTSIRSHPVQMIVMNYAICSYG